MILIWLAVIQFVGTYQNVFKWLMNNSRLRWFLSVGLPTDNEWRVIDEWSKMCYRRGSFTCYGYSVVHILKLENKLSSMISKSGNNVHLQALHRMANSLLLRLTIFREWVSEWVSSAISLREQVAFDNMIIIMKKSISSDGLQFNRYQQNEQWSSTFTHWTQKGHDIWR